MTCAYFNGIAAKHPGPAGAGAELLVDRGRFDAILLGAADAAGVRVLQPARARAAEHVASGWRVEVAADGGTHTILAERLVDASGRSGFLAGSREPLAPRTVALCGYLEGEALPRATLVEAIRDGWCWGAPVPGGLFSSMVFLDPRFVSRLRPDALESVWRGQLARAELFERLSAAPLRSPVFARDATPYRVADPVGASYLRVGEASFGLDPLSATGVEKAMQTGLVAATALHTMILWSERTELCERFCRQRHEEAVSAHADWAAGYYRQVERFAESPYWRARSAARPDVQSAPLQRYAPRAIGPNREPTTLRLSERARWIQEPCIVGDEIRSHSALTHPNLDRPVAFLGGVELAGLLERVPRGTDLGGILALWSGRVPLHDTGRVVQWMIQKQILEPIN